MATGRRLRKDDRSTRESSCVHGRQIVMDGGYNDRVVSEGDLVQVFSNSQGRWVNGIIASLFDDELSVRVEYMINGDLHGKTMQLRSPDLILHAARSINMREEIDPCRFSVSQSTESGSATDGNDFMSAAGNSSSGDPSAQTAEMEHFARQIAKEKVDVARFRSLIHLSTLAKCELLDMADKNQGEAPDLVDRHRIRIRPPEFITTTTEQTRELQRKEPINWAMSYSDWKKVVRACINSKRFSEIKASKRFGQFVTVYDVNDYFVKPWTRGTGVGIALHMHKEGRQADVMISHAWGEDVVELADALKEQAMRGRLTDDTNIWFCTFAQYQPEDKAGPTIDEQLELEPFRKVVTSVGRMLAVHTTKTDLYCRLWCVHELDEAIERKKEVVAAMSSVYLDKLRSDYLTILEANGKHMDAVQAAGVKVKTACADCNPKDKSRLMTAVFSREGGFDRIDKVVSEFRKDAMLSVLVPAIKERLEHHGEDMLPSVLEAMDLGDSLAAELVLKLAVINYPRAYDALLDVMEIAVGVHCKNTGQWTYSYKINPEPAMFESILSSYLAAFMKMMEGNGEEAKIATEALVVFTNPWRSKFADQHRGQMKRDMNNGVNQARKDKNPDQRLLIVQRKRMEIQSYFEERFSQERKAYKKQHPRGRKPPRAPAYIDDDNL